MPLPDKIPPPPSRPGKSKEKESVSVFDNAKFVGVDYCLDGVKIGHFPCSSLVHGNYFAVGWNEACRANKTKGMCNAVWEVAIGQACLQS